MSCAPRCMTSYVKYPVFPVWHPRNTLPHLPPTQGEAALGQDADHLLVTPMLNTNRRPCVQPLVRRSTVGIRAFPVAVPQLWNTLPFQVTSAPSMEIFCGAGDWRPTYHAVILWQTHALTCVLLLYCFIQCITVVLAVFLLGHFLKFCSIGWMIDWSRRCFAPDVNLSSNEFVVADANTPRWAAGVFVRCGWYRSGLSWWTGLTSSC